MVTTSQILNISFILCDTYIIILPCSFKDFIVLNKLDVSVSDRLLVGSSKAIICALRISALEYDQ